MGCSASLNPEDELLVQATHDQVPPDVLEPVLRQLVDQFIHDRARPAVMTVGIKTVRELCARSPLIMTSDLLQVKSPLLAPSISHLRSRASGRHLPSTAGVHPGLCIQPRSNNVEQLSKFGMADGQAEAACGDGVESYKACTAWGV